MKPVEQKVDAILTAFNQWFQRRGNEPLIKAEMAAIKTFCYFLTHETDRPKMPVLEEKVDDDAQNSGGSSVQSVQSRGDAGGGSGATGGPVDPGA